MAGIKHKATKASGEKGLAIEWNDDHKITGDVPFDQNQGLEFVAHNAATPPAGPVEGQLWFNTTTKILNVWDGSDWASQVGIEDAIAISMIIGK